MKRFSPFLWPQKGSPGSLCLAAFLASSIALFAQETPPVSLPVESLHVPEGMEITRWASTPQLYNPTNMDVDHKGRIWVTEGVNYRGKQGSRPEGDRIVILEDTDNDGTADKSSVFYQSPDLSCPLGIAVFDNQVVVSQAPNLILLTDVDRNLKFDPEVDKKEILLTGFNAEQHDHSLHSLTAGPDGKWYFNNGNCGALFTDKSGKTFRIGGPYYKSGGGVWPIDTRAIAGEKSDDGHVWTPGFTVRMDPDGSNVEIIGHGYRNSYENINDSYGNLFQNDNDDPPACRNSYVMEYGSAGYFTEDGKRFYGSEWRHDQAHSHVHWRQADPDTFDAGDIYGGGSPTGVAFYENGAFDDSFNGSYLSCEPGRNVIFKYQPEPEGAGFKLERSDLVTSNKTGEFAGADFSRVAKDVTADGKTIKIAAARAIESQMDPRLFRPSDVTVGADGAIYLCDWYDGRVGGHGSTDKTWSGTIYRIAPKGFDGTSPALDLSTTAGQIAALRSPANNVRYLGFKALQEQGDAVLSDVLALTKDENPYIAARGLWLLPQLGPKGIEEAKAFLKSDQANTRLVALRALRRTDVDMIEVAQQLASDPNPAVRRDVALALRDLDKSRTMPILVELARQVDIKDKNAVLALRLGAGDDRDDVWTAMKQELGDDALKWSPLFSKLTWSMGAKSSVPDLVTRINSTDLSEEDRKFAMESLAFVQDKSAADAMYELVRSENPLNWFARFWFERRAFGAWEDFGLLEQLKELGIFDPDKPVVSVTVPEPEKSPKFSVEDVLALEGNAEKGAITKARCIMCHKIDEQGIAFGPDLRGWGARQSYEALVNAIVNPSDGIAHSYEGKRITLLDGQEIHGKLTRWRSPTTVVSTGGIEQRILDSKVDKIEPLGRSLMLSADQMGMTAQDVADIATYLQSY